MKRAALILAALAAILTAAAAPVRTATENFVTKKIAEAVTNDVASAIASATNDPTIVRGQKLAPLSDPDRWDIKVSDALSAGVASKASSADEVPWSGVLNRPDTLAGYGVADDATNVVYGIVTQVVAPSNPTFSNAVLSVGLNIDTNSVAVLNEIAETFGGLPIEGTATTVGGLLAALAAAVAWLKRNKADKSALDELAAKVEYPIYAVPSTGVLKDRSLNTTSLASVTVPNNFTDLLIRASVASSLSVTTPETIATKYGDTFPGEAGEYLITITKTGAAEAYVRTIKLEVANA